MMQNVLQRWQDLPREDLFLFWQNEARLKKALRQASSGYRDLKLHNESEYVFFRQSMAYGAHKPVFLRILFYNIDSLPVQSALLDGPSTLCMDFLRFLPAAINIEKPVPHNLQFLINLYREDFQACYTDILAVLGSAECEYLLDRTANKNLRKLLKERLSRLYLEQSEVHYRLLQPTPAARAYPTLYGNKIDLLKQTVRLLTIDPGTLSENSSNRLATYLEAADQLFMLGMLSECLMLLQSVYQQWQTLKTSFLLEDNNSMNKSISRILGKSLPIYALLNNLAPYQYSQNIYRQYFPELQADNSAQLYLQLYQNLQINRTGNPQYSWIEMTHIFIHSAQREDDGLASYFRNGPGLGADCLALILTDIDRDLTILPHRALVTMEILRFLAWNNKISMSKQLASQLLRNYLTLYKWIPVSRFLNHDIYQQIAGSVDDELQNEAKQLLAETSNFTDHSIRKLYTDHPDKFNRENNIALWQRLLGSFLGVLK